MKGKTIFIAGVYGTGKSTLCSGISTNLGIPHFSASDLISSKIGEQYGRNKQVADKVNNQNILVKSVQELFHHNEIILLAGHFCIFGKENNVEILPEFVYHQLNIENIILLEANIQQIQKHLLNRDGKDYFSEALNELIKAERKQSEIIAHKLSCDLFIHKMLFNENDVVKIIEYLKRGI